MTKQNLVIVNLVLFIIINNKFIIIKSTWANVYDHLG